MKIILSVNLVAITEKLNIGHENDNGHESLAMESTLSTTAFSSIQISDDFTSPDQLKLNLRSLTTVGRNSYYRFAMKLRSPQQI